ncbi:MAG: biopolymer transporter ExbD [Kiritimatiellae bacterium]|nr:biopolymer transporter ExbD [Kiritimatiellia bacterium]
MNVNIPTADAPELDVSALIDMVFLLLVFFMVTASLVKSEGDLSIKLPGIVQQAVTVDMPDEQIIEVHATGRVNLNGLAFGTMDSNALPDLVAILMRYKMASDASHNKAMVTIWAEDEAKHQRVIDVMNACAFAGIENVTFTSSVD